MSGNNSNNNLNNSINPNSQGYRPPLTQSPKVYITNRNYSAVPAQNAVTPSATVNNDSSSTVNRNISFGQALSGSSTPEPLPTLQTPEVQAPIAQATAPVVPQYTQPQVENKYTYETPVEKFTIPEVQKPKQNNGMGCNPFAIIASIITSFFKAIFDFISLIKNLLFTIIFLIIIGVVGFLVVLYYKPPVVWNPVKTYLNAELVKPDYTATTANDIYGKINTNALSNQPVKLTNSDLTVLIREFSMLGEKFYAQSHKNGMKFYINIDTTERPLWFVIDTEVTDKKKIIITKAGFGRFDTPEQLNGFLTDTMGQLFEFLEKQITAENSLIAFNQILKAELQDKNLQLLQVEFITDNVVLYYRNNTPKDSLLDY